MASIARTDRLTRISLLVASFPALVIVVLDADPSGNGKEAVRSDSPHRSNDRSALLS